MSERVWHHQMLAGWVAECTCFWRSEPAKEGGREAAVALGQQHMREAHGD